MLRQFIRTMHWAGNTVMSKQKAVLCHRPNEDRFTFSFHLECSEPRISKQFNMARSTSETLETFLNRLRENIEKKLESKTKKKKKSKKSQTDDCGSSIDEAAATHVPEIKVKLNNELFQVESDVIAKEFLSQQKGMIQIDILSIPFEIDVNPPLVQNVKLPEIAIAGYLIYPFKLSIEFANQQDSEFDWFVSDVNVDPSQVNLTKTAWTKRHKGFFYMTSKEDINRYIKLEITPKMGNRVGFKHEIITKNIVSAGPGYCPFEDRHAFTNHKLGTHEFRVVTYNILADLYADSDYSRTVLFPQCPSYAMDIAYRKSLFIKELLGYNADIMCLQEVDNKIFDGDLNPVFSQNEYEGAFSVKGGVVTEGLACFWNSDKFEKLNGSRMVLAEAVLDDDSFTDILGALNVNEALKENFLRRTTALQTVILKSKNHSEGLIIGNTHLFFKPDADHIRLLQTAMIVRQLEKIKTSAEKNFGMAFSVLLCGDFNSTPPFGVLEFMQQKVIKENHTDWCSAEGEHVQNLQIEHKLNMESACGTPKYTTYTVGFKDCLDYIYYQTDNISVTSVVPFPLEEEMEKYQALPNIVFPSDHIACIADLKWKLNELK